LFYGLFSEHRQHRWTAESSFSRLICRPSSVTNPFKKSKIPTTIQVACPFCQRDQSEPSAAVSTFCRSCGEHFEIVDGTVVSPDAASISGIAAVIEPTDGGEMVRVPGTRKPVSTKPPPEPRGQSKPGLMDRLKASWSAKAGGGDESQPATGREGLQAKQRNSSDQRPARCFECGHIQFVTSAARSTQCGRCTKYISLEDYEITTPWFHNIHTRGDIVVAKKAKMIGTEIACHNLVVNGEISATLDCSGDATFRGPARVLGNLHCRHLRIEKKARVTAPQGVVAESVEVYGQFDGDLLCSGTVSIYRSGRVLGDVTAANIELKEGGLVAGKTNLDDAIQLPPPPKKTRRFDTPSA
jgi:cytoskeletal protein CcmA (bactofilin family)